MRENRKTRVQIIQNEPQAHRPRKAVVTRRFPVSYFAQKRLTSTGAFAIIIMVGLV